MQANISCFTIVTNPLLHIPNCTQSLISQNVDALLVEIR